ncbi:Copper transport protein CTR2 [Termitomyces sp. J132]|nr:Copper transport protein CTR2 [Termitomyces sp. J132]
MHTSHSMSGGHDMPMGSSCSMHMLWNTQIVDTCIVFPSWHIRSTHGFIFSCLIIIALGILYEWLRGFQKQYEIHLARSLVFEGKGKGRATPRASGRNTPEYDSEESGLLNGRRVKKSPESTPVPFIPRVVRASLYGLTVFLSFFLMLIFMTYNAYLIIAVVLGAAIGHYIFGSNVNVNDLLSEISGLKTMACH